jgi:hypothetical protein
MTMNTELNEITGLNELSAWLHYQLAAWADWAAAGDGAWIGLASGNPAFPTLGAFFIHAWGPLQRYSAQHLLLPAVAPPDPPPTAWGELEVWARQNLERYDHAILSLTPETAELVYGFTTRSAGVIDVTPREVLFHAGLHCAWHLAGIAHLLRAAGTAPPSKLDFLFMAAGRHRSAPDQ